MREIIAEAGEIVDKENLTLKDYQRFRAITRQKKPEDTVQVNLSENQVGFVMSDILILTRIIQGQFPDYKQVLPKETNNQYTIDRRSFSDALERGNVIASESNNVVRLGFDDSHLMLKANAISLGDFQSQKVLIWFYPKASTPG